MSKYLLCIIGILLLLAGCGGGDGSSITSKNANDSGSVAVMLTDGPADAYDSIWIWITEISLLTDDDADPVVVFESDDPGGWKVDLLELRDQDAVVTVKDDIPAGHYSKIRLRVADIQIDGGEDAPCSPDDIEIKLPSGKIDLKPKGGFEVIPGETLGIRLDVDCDKSIQLHPAGKSGKCIFRPVVFVEIDTLDAIDECPRVTKGIIDTILDDNTGFTLQLGDGRGFLTVLLDENVVVFGENGVPVEPEELWNVLTPDQLVHVRGELDNEGNLHASVIIVGRVVLVKGIVETPYEEGMFTLDLIPPHAFTGDSVDVDVSEDTLVMTGCDQMAIPEDIQVGMMSRVVGKVSLEDQSIKAIAVLLKDVTVTGMLTAVSDMDDTGGYTLSVRVSDVETVEIYMPAGVEPYIENIGPVPIEDLQRLTDCNQMVGVSIIVKSKDVSPMIAADVRVDAITVEGDVTAVDLAEDNVTVEAITLLRDGEVDEERVAVSPTAIIEPEDTVINPDDHRVTIIGLNTCEEDEYDYQAYMVIIQEPNSI